MNEKASGIEIPSGTLRLEGQWCMPRRPRGVVLFAHGSGSSRWSPRNQRVAAALQAAGFGTLLFDLLTSEEDQALGARFDIERLTERLVAATRWVENREDAIGHRLGYFGASTGAAAAMGAAAELPHVVAAIVSRGGRPDLAAHALSAVRAPTLFLVGGEDFQVLELNRRAALQLRCPHRLEVIPGATHLFEEPGTLEEVERLATSWFEQYLAGSQQPVKTRTETGTGGFRGGIA